MLDMISVVGKIIEHMAEKQQHAGHSCGTVIPKQINFRWCRDTWRQVPV